MSRLRVPAALACLLAALFLWRAGCGLLERIPLAGAATLRCADPLTAADARRMERAEKRAGTDTPLVLWTQQDGREAQALSTGRRANAALVLARGDVRLLFPATLAAEDTAGALVDRATAEALFGTAEAAGGRIECLGRRYTIRDVIDVPLPTVVVQTGENDETAFTNVTFAAPQKEAFLLRHGLAGELVENAAWRSAAGFVCALPVVWAWCWALWRMMRAAVRLGRYPVRQAVCLAGLLALTAVFALWVLAALPQSWAPPRWSEFGFWPERFGAWAGDALKLAAAHKFRPDLFVMAQAGKAAACGVLSCAVLSLFGKLAVDLPPRQWYNGSNGGASMMISTRGRYALRLMIDLAQNDNGGYVTLKDVCARQEISLKYLEQIVAQLSKAGLLKSARGAQGGYRLAKAPQEYTAGEILRLTEGNLAPVACLEHEPNECPRHEKCPALKFWQGLYGVVNSYVEGVTLAQLAGEDAQETKADRMPVYFL